MDHARIEVEVQRTVAGAVRPSARVLETAAMFGLGVDDNREICIVPPTRIPLPRGGVVFITGPSGGGKSMVLSLIGERCREQGVGVIHFDDLPALPDVPLVDALDLPLDQTTSVLAMAGLADAFVMLRSPCELSDGQRWRLRFAQVLAAMARIDPDDDVESETQCVVLADEFAATLDRQTAKVISRNVRRWVNRTPRLTFVCATTHDDVMESLQPDVLVWKGLGDDIRVIERGGPVEPDTAGASVGPEASS